VSGAAAAAPDLFRSGGVYAARSDFSIAQSHWAAEKSLPVFFDVCGKATRVEKCPSLKAIARLRAGNRF